MQNFNTPEHKKRRIELRKNQTDTEKILWSSLRKKQINGIKFIRQYGIGPYIADFYSPVERIAIELDRDIHLDQVEYDQDRDLYLES